MLNPVFWLTFAGVFWLMKTAAEALWRLVEKMNSRNLLHRSRSRGLVEIEGVVISLVGSREASEHVRTDDDTLHRRAA